MTKILCKKCEPTKTITDYQINKDTEKGRCNRCKCKVEKDD